MIHPTMLNHSAWILKRIAFCHKRDCSTYGKYRKFVDTLGLVVGLLDQVLVYIFEVGDGHILLKVLVQDLSIIH
jgi:hypothetical protein